MTTHTLPKVILHEHIEGSVTPALATILAQRHHVHLPDNFLYAQDQYDADAFPDGRYAYDESDFGAFIHTYDVVASLIRTPEDYYLVVSDFLTRNAKQGLIYCELIASPFHMSGATESHSAMDPQQYHRVMDAIENAIADVRQKTGVETRLHAVGIRHLGVNHVTNVIKFIEQNPRASVTGFNIAGDERSGTFADLMPLLPTLQKLGLGRSYHAGEICPADSIEQAIDYGAMRIGHGIQAIDSPATIQRLIEQNITLEVAITSNQILVDAFSDNPAAHPVRKLYDTGVRLCLNTDDAGIFGTTIAKEYQLAANMFGFTRIELLDISLCAVEAAFINKEIKQHLIQRIYNDFNADDIDTLKHSLSQERIPALKQRMMQRYQHLIR